jgi:hypothetical protein
MIILFKIQISYNPAYALEVFRSFDILAAQ